MLVLWALGVVLADAPEVGGEVEGEEGEEEAGDFEPEDSADAAEGAEEGSGAAACGAGVSGSLLGDFARGFANLRVDLCCDLGVHLPEVGQWDRLRLTCWCGGGFFFEALFGDAPGYADSDTHSFSKLIRVQAHSGCLILSLTALSGEH